MGWDGLALLAWLDWTTQLRYSMALIYFPCLQLFISHMTCLMTCLTTLPEKLETTIIHSTPRFPMKERVWRKEGQVFFSFASLELQIIDFMPKRINPAYNARLELSPPQDIQREAQPHPFPPILFPQEKPAQKLASKTTSAVTTCLMIAHLSLLKLPDTKAYPPPSSQAGSSKIIQVIWISRSISLLLAPLREEHLASPLSSLGSLTNYPKTIVS